MSMKEATRKKILEAHNEGYDIGFANGELAERDKWQRRADSLATLDRKLEKEPGRARKTAAKKTAAK